MRTLKNGLKQYILTFLFGMSLVFVFLEALSLIGSLRVFKNETDKFATFMARNFETTLVFESREDFNKSVSYLDFDKDYHGVALYYPDGKLFSLKGKVHDAKNGHIDWSKKSLTIRKEVYSNKKLVGYFLIQRNFNQVLAATLIQFFVGMSIFTILLVTIYIMGLNSLSRLTKPIEGLSKAIRKMSKGKDLSIRFSQDPTIYEVYELKESFNDLIDEMESFQNELESLNASLEHQVEDRTKELQAVLRNLKKYQNQVVDQEKKASLGAMTAGVAHEIKNPLNLIMNSSHFILSYINDDLDDYINKIAKGSISVEELEFFSQDLRGIESSCEIIINNGKRATEVVDKMLSLSQADNYGVREIIDVKKVLKSALRLSEESERAQNSLFDVDIDMKFDQNLCLSAYSLGLERAFINIFDNCFYALKEKVKKADNDYRPKLTIKGFLKDHFVILEIMDNGVGIEPEHLRKINDPFFTTKLLGEGVGLGLSIVCDIIIKHEGEMKVDSEFGKFTRVEISLPIVERK